VKVDLPKAATIVPPVIQKRLGRPVLTTKGRMQESFRVLTALRSANFGRDVTVLRQSWYRHQALIAPQG
jgi:hypothetical protein